MARSGSGAPQSCILSSCSSQRLCYVAVRSLGAGSTAPSLTLPDSSGRPRLAVRDPSDGLGVDDRIHCRGNLIASVHRCLLRGRSKNKRGRPLDVRPDVDPHLPDLVIHSAVESELVEAGVAPSLLSQRTSCDLSRGNVREMSFSAVLPFCPVTFSGMFVHPEPLPFSIPLLRFR